MVNEELCEIVVEVRRVSDREMIVLLIFEEDVLRLCEVCSVRWKKTSLFTMS